MKTRNLSIKAVKSFLIFLLISFFSIPGGYNVFYKENHTISSAEVKATTIFSGLTNDNNLHLTNEFATHYFYNLRENLGENIHDSCGYVGLGMLLGYYDAYWNDSFIDENFEQNANLSTNSFTASVSSSGVKSEKALLDNKLTLLD